jgi:hypothetical protein
MYDAVKCKVKNRRCIYAGILSPFTLNITVNLSREKSATYCMKIIEVICGHFSSKI